LTVDEVDVSVLKPEARAKGPLSRVCASLCGLLLLFDPAASLGVAQDPAANEIVWKVNFLAKSAAFIEWPVDSPLHNANAFRWCVAKAGADRAEHIRHTIESNPVEAGDARIPLTMSLGMANSAEWPALDGEALTRKADEALYRAKSEGRNRAVIARPEGFAPARKTGRLSLV
jgi:hypothetical protein